jgi:hypothetical protein
MKFRNKLLFTAAAALVLGILASASAFAAKPAPAAAGPALPKGAENAQPYMISAAGLANADVMKCIRGKMKLPADLHEAENVSSAQDCQSAKN